MPEVAKPKRHISLRTKLIWTGVVLLLYLIMGEIPLYGAAPGAQDPFKFARLIFASKRGSLLELGIGPIVTAGLIMQLLAGAEIIKFDFKDPEERGIFTAATKFLTIIVTIAEAAAFIFSGLLQMETFSFVIITIVFAQLVIATIILMLLDEMLQKGWGLGSGISLFIAVGVAEAIFLNLFSVLPVSENGVTVPYGLIPYIFAKGFAGEWLSSLIRPQNFPSLLGFIATLATIFIILYAEGVRIEIPISMARYRGIRSVYPIKLLYVSNIPIILASTLLMDLQIFSQVIWTSFNPANTDPFFNLIIQMENNTVTGGLMYYLMPPQDYFQAVADPLRTLTFSIMMIIMAIIFAVVWVEVGGLSAEKVSEQLIDSGMQIPGFRRRPYSVSIILKKYIPTVTVLGGFFVGVIAAVSQILGVFGGGMGILLMIDILIQYYQLLMREQIEEMYPAIYKLIKV
jgi:preprotein translocase SecY subunit